MPRATPSRDARIEQTVQVLDRLDVRVEISCDDEDSVWLARDEVEQPLLEVLDERLLAVAVDVDVERVDLELLVHDLH